MPSAVQIITTYFTDVVPAGPKSRPCPFLTDAAFKGIVVLEGPL